MKMFLVRWDDDCETLFLIQANGGGDAVSLFLKNREEAGALPMMQEDVDAFAELEETKEAIESGAARPTLRDLASVTEIPFSDGVGVIYL